jgi:GntR family transcriptional regulator
MRRNEVGTHGANEQLTARGHTARRLRDLLRSSILRGHFSAGTLPSEAELMRTHRATRGAVRDALAMLRDEGLVSRVQGLGTFAISPAVMSRLVDIHGMRTAPTDVVWNGGQRPRIIDFSVVPTPAVVAARVLPTVSATCLRVEYVATLDGEPIGMACNYVMFPEAQALVEVPFTNDWYHYLRDAGIEIGSSEFAIGCAAADAGLAALLQIPAGRPVLTLEQLICDHTGKPFNVAFCHSRSDKFSLVTIAVSEALQSSCAGATETADGRSVRLHADSEPAVPTDWYAWLSNDTPAEEAVR